ncbi:MAG: type II toxin-antitoxin system RelE/ParE family toxin [Patescibacteria group bacterium]
MGKLKRLLKRLSKSEQKQTILFLEKLEQGEFDGLDIKRLKGKQDIFRLRKGKLRVIFYFQENEFRLISIEHGSDKTYRSIDT